MHVLDRLFWHRLWMTPVASYVGFFSLMYVAFSGANPLLLLSAFSTLALLLGVTAGMHRLFCHAAFQTSPFWHMVLAIWGTLAIYGSTVQWAAMHATHHKHSDTDLDPHYSGWRYLIWKKNRKTQFNSKVLTRLYRTRLHRWLHNFYVIPALVLSTGLLLFGGPELLIYGYLAPLGWLHLVGSFHQVFAHGKNGARQLPGMEFVMFTGGEWNHQHHHNRPRDLRFGRFDMGYHFIRAIQRAPGTP